MLAKLRRRGAGGPLSYSWLDATCHTDFVAAFGLGESRDPQNLGYSRLISGNLGEWRDPQNLG